MPCLKSIFVDVSKIFSVDPTEFRDVTRAEK